jgi:hypothetical protein
MTAIWRIERTQSRRFPFRIAIEQDGRLLFAVRAQSPWPPPGGQIFCLREREHDPGECLEGVERVPIAAMNRIGPRLVLAIDRPTRKRCEFLVLSKRRADGERYEQIFFRTEAAIRAHHGGGRVELRPREAFQVVVDARERYPWRFPQADVSRRALAVGDYALVRGAIVRAVVERKTFDNLLNDIGTIRSFHQGLAQLASQPRAALVIEAQYADFLDASRTDPWKPAHIARVLAEIAALHPKLPMVFAGNRKLANDWTLRWFAAIDADDRELPLFVSELESSYEGDPPAPLDDRIRESALARVGVPFTTADIARSLPDADMLRIVRVLRSLRTERRLGTIGRGRGLRWVADPDQ